MGKKILLLILPMVAVTLASKSGRGACPDAPKDERISAMNDLDMAEEWSKDGPLVLAYRDGFDEEATCTCIELNFNETFYQQKTYTYRVLNATETNYVFIPGLQVILPNLPVPIFGAKDPYWTGVLEMLHSEANLIYARSCVPDIDNNGYEEAYYVFLKVNGPDFGMEDRECIAETASELYGRSFKECGVCYQPNLPPTTYEYIEFED